MADSDAPVVAFDKEAAYKQSQEQCRSFFEKYDVDRTGRMATINAVLKLNFPSFWFVGFYTVKPDAEEVLQIGAYQGLLIASGIIPFGKGVCGTCAKEQKTQIVGNVCSITNYIACDENTKSEIVVPVYDSSTSKLIAVLDIDSENYDNFDEVDQRELEALLTAWF